MVTKKKLIEILIKRGDWKEEYTFLIDLLYDNLKKLKEVNKELKGNLMVWGSGEQTFKVRNQSVRTYNELNDNIRKISEKLLLNPKDWKEYNKSKESESDGFDD